MEMWIWDVQHGSAAYLCTPTNRHIVVDLGTGDLSSDTPAFSPLRLLEANGVHQLDEVIITHPHRDHLDDIWNFDRLSPKVLRRPVHLTEAEIRAANRKADEDVLDKYFEVESRYSEPVDDENDPESFSNAGMSIQCFTPVGCSRSNINNHSIVSFFNHASSTVCVPGDNEAQSWRELLGRHEFRQWLSQTDVLIASHHGREAGYCDDIFVYCSPKLVVVSDGPEGGTSAVEKYRAKATGWIVHSRSGGDSKQRWVVTTRADGSIRIKTGFNGDAPFLEVSIE